MLKNVFGALALIVSDVIDQWGSRTDRQDLIDTIREQTLRILDLEEELDGLARENARLQSELSASEERTSLARGRDPDPFDPYPYENICMACGYPAGPYWCPHCKAT